MKSTHKSGGFTLTELLAVILIMGALTATLIPAFVTLTKTTGLSRAVFPLKGALRSARQHAMTHNKHVSVVFPHDPSESEHTTDSLDVLYATVRTKRLFLKSYNLFEHEPRGGAYGTWLGPWEYLPPGVVFSTASDPLSDGSINTIYTRHTKNHRGFLIDDKLRDLPCITFRPDGTVISPEVAQYGIFFQTGTTTAEFPIPLKAEDLGDDVIGIKVHPLTGEMQVVEHFEQ